jgi:hypothetical protein
MNPEFHSAKPIDVKEGDTVRDLTERITNTLEKIQKNSKNPIIPLSETPDESPLPRFGLVHISSTYRKTMKSIEWMDENALVSSFDFNQFDIIDCRMKPNNENSFLSTIDPNASSIRFVIAKPNPDFSEESEVIEIHSHS